MYLFSDAFIKSYWLSSLNYMSYILLCIFLFKFYNIVIMVIWTYVKEVTKKNIWL